MGFGYLLSVPCRLSRFLEKHNDIALLADLMGHESIETTRIYLRMTAGEQRKIINDVVTW